MPPFKLKLNLPQLKIWLQKILSEVNKKISAFGASLPQLKQTLSTVSHNLRLALVRVRQRTNPLKNYFTKDFFAGASKKISSSLTGPSQIKGQIKDQLKHLLSGTSHKISALFTALRQIQFAPLFASFARTALTALYRLQLLLKYIAVLLIAFFTDDQKTAKDPVRDYIRETRLFTDRVRIASFMTMVLMTVIVSRLIYLQILNHEHYTTLSQNNRISIVALPPPRGIIYDRNGVVLAQNIPSFSLEIVPEQVKDLKATVAELQKIISISDTDIKRFRISLSQKRTSNGIPLRFHLSEEEVARFAIDRPRFIGVDVAASLTRYYPLGSLGVHAIGYVGRISENELEDLDPANYNGTTHIGKTGVEKSYESILHGTVGFEQVETNSQGRRLRVLGRSPARAGQNLYLNIDARLQSLAEAALGANRGAVVAIEPKTGAVLALASMPGYDPNPFVNGIDSDAYNLLAKSPDQPLYNRAMRGEYPPGSTVKPFVGLGGLELGVITQEKNTYCPGFFQLGGQGRQYRDWKHGGHGEVNLDKAIEQSCDVYFYTLARAIGIDRLHDFMDLFGFGKKTGIDIGGERPGLMPSTAWKARVYKQVWFPGETLSTGIGQGYTLATPLQLAVATSAMANRGGRIKPRVVMGTYDQATNKVTPLVELAPLSAIPVVKAANWQSVVTGMIHVTQGAHGTARLSALGAPYTIAGKTGTAQVFGLKQNEKYSASSVAERLRDHALFISFAPAEDPRIAIAVIVENGSHGATAAAPISRMLMDQYLIYNDSPDYVPPPKAETTAP